MRGEPAVRGDHARFMTAIEEAIEKVVRERMIEVERQLEYEAEKFGAATASGRY